MLLLCNKVSLFMRNVFLLIGVISLLLFFSCDESFEINDDWSDITIVYGVLNQYDTAHYIKINKAFLGDANVYEMAKEADSIQYASEVDVRLIEYEIVDVYFNPYISDNWKLTNRDPIILERTNELLKDSLSTSGESGVFGTEVNYLYKTAESLSGLHKYVLEIRIPGKDEVISSETFLIRDLIINYPPPIQSGFMVRMENYLNPATTKWETAIYGKIHQHVLRLRYLEIIDTDSAIKFIDIKYPSQIARNIRLPHEYQGVEMSQIVGGSSFFSNVGASIEENPNAKRKDLGLEFLFYVGGNNLNTYLSVSNASVYGHQPEFSNIINGTGIFAARYNYSYANARLSDESKDSLAYGYYTKHLNFANYKGQWK